MKDFDPLQSSLASVRTRLRTLLLQNQASVPQSPAACAIQIELENTLNELDQILVSEDIILQRQLAHQAQQPTQELNAIFNSLADAVIVLNRDGTVQRVNPVIRRLVGFEPAGLDLPTILQRLQIHDPDGRPVDVSDLPSSRALRGETTRGIHLVATPPSGKKFHVLSSGSPLYTGGVFSGAVVTWHDITDRVRTEQALQESEERYRSLFQNNHTIMLVIDPASGSIIDANPAACRFYGYTFHTITHLKITDINLLSPVEVHQEMERARREARNHFEFRHRLADGTVREVDVFSGPITLNGKQYLYSIIHDDTKRRQALTALAQEVEINTAMAELSHSLLSPTKLEDISDRVLQHARRLTRSRLGFVGYIDPATGNLISPNLSRDVWDACQVADKSVAFHSCKGLWGWVIQNRKTLLTNKLAEDPRSTGVPPGHLPIQAYLGVPAVIGDSILGVISLANPDQPYKMEDQALVERLADLYAIALQRQQAEQALRQERDFITSIVDTTGALVILLDPLGRIVRFNGACEAVSGFSLDEVQDQPFWDILLLPEEKEQVQDMFDRLISGDYPINFENYWVTREGRLRRITWTNTVLFAEDGRVRYVVATGVDITERVQALEEVRQTANHLELQHYLMHTLERERLNIAHDLHDGAMQGFLGAIYGLKSAMTDVTSIELREKLEQVAGTLQQEIQELRAFCYELRPPALAPFGLEKAIRSDAITFQEKHPELKVHLDLEPDGNFLPEPTRIALFRIYRELLVNVLRHAKSDQVEVRFYLEPQQARLEVQDNGVGFELPDAWVELARRGNLGLIGAIERAEALGGMVMVDSRPGGGTLVRAVIPLAPQQIS